MLDKEFIHKDNIQRWDLDTYLETRSPCTTVVRVRNVSPDSKPLELGRDAFLARCLITRALRRLIHRRPKTTLLSPHAKTTDFSVDFG